MRFLKKAEKEDLNFRFQAEEINKIKTTCMSSKPEIKLKCKW